jgi:hypothetical protein
MTFGPDAAGARSATLDTGRPMHPGTWASGVSATIQPFGILTAQQVRAALVAATAAPSRTTASHGGSTAVPWASSCPPTVPGPYRWPIPTIVSSPSPAAPRW